MTCWTVMLPGEDAGTSELYGMFRSEAAAQKAADKWNRDNHSDDWEWKAAQVMPIMPAREIANAR